MTHWVIASSLQFRLLVLACVAVLMIVGARQLREVPVDVLPVFSRPYVEVQTKAEIQAKALGLSDAEVESLITTPRQFRQFHSTHVYSTHVVTSLVGDVARTRLMFI